MRIPVCSALIVLLVSFASDSTTPAFAQTLSRGAIKSNLDLPLDAGPPSDDADDDVPEVITFYSQNYETDGIFYVIDRSGTMQDTCELDIAKREVSRNIAQFSDRVQFGVVFFDRGLLKFPASGRPADADSYMKSAGFNWVQSVHGGAGSCCREGILAALQYANVSSARRKVIVYVGDGGGTCAGANEESYLEQTLAIVKTQNFQRTQINAIGLLPIGQIQAEFLSRLTAQNDGTFIRIQITR